MPIPKPHENEPKQDYVSRCIQAIHSEYTEDGQAAAVCYQTWRDAKKAMDRQALLKSIHSRKDRSGVLTADRYFRGIEACFSGCEGGFCPTKLFKDASPDQWKAALEQAERQLTFTHDDLLISKERIEKDVAEQPSLLLAFECVITTPRRDRDKDILLTSGATLDPKAPLLWQHVGMMPLGPQLGSVKSPEKLRGRFGIADTELGRDAAKLVEAGAVRISHGFEPDDGEDAYEPLDDVGWLFKRFQIFEVSLVSIPSNVDAVITAYSRNELKHEAVRAWGKKEFDTRPVVVPGFTAKEPTVEAEQKPCSCHANAGEAKGATYLENCKCPECGYTGPVSEFMHGGSIDNEMQGSFDAMSQKMIERSESESPEVVASLILSLKGVMDRAVARREDIECQAFLHELGI